LQNEFNTLNKTKRFNIGQVKKKSNEQQIECELVGGAFMPKVSFNANNSNEKMKRHLEAVTLNIKSESERQGLTYKEIAVATRVGKTTIQNRLNNPQKFELEELFLIAKKLKITVPQLLGFEPIDHTVL